MYSFTSIETPRIMIDNRLKSTASGLNIFSIELRARSKPIINIASDTISPAMYSKRPWP